MSLGTNASISSGLFTSLLTTSGGSTGMTVSCSNTQNMDIFQYSKKLLTWDINVIAKTCLGSKYGKNCLHETEVCKNENNVDSDFL